MTAKLAFRTTVAVLVVSAVVWAFTRVLLPDGPVWAAYAFAVLEIGLATCREILPDNRRGAHATLMTVRRVVGIFGAAALLVNILAVPQSAYVTWFRLAVQGNARGSVSFVVLLLIAYFGSLFAAAMPRNGIGRPSAGLAFAVSVVIAVIIEKPFTYWLSISIGAVAIILNAGSRFHGKGSATHRIRTALAMMIFLGVAIGFGAIGKSSILPKGNRTVDDSLSPAIRGALLKLFPQFPVLYAIPGYGYSFEGRSLGSTPVLSDRGIFRVEAAAGSTVYLRTAAYDTYDQSQWSDDRHALQYATAHGKEAVTRLYDRNLLLQGATDIPPPPNTIEVTLLSDFYSFLPLAPGVAAFNYLPSGSSRVAASISPAGRVGANRIGIERQAGAPQVQYGNLATGFFLSEPMVAGDRVVIRLSSESTVGSDNGGAGLPLGRVLLSQADAALAGVDSVDPGTERNRYLEVPKSVPERVRSYAMTFGEPLTVHVPVDAQPASDPAQDVRPGIHTIPDFGAAEQSSANDVLTRAAAIRYAVQSGSIYSLDTKEPPPGVDLVDYFLFQNRHGYCVHYATSFVILARLSGIPARYATGFLVNMPPDSSVRDISGLTAHAWPEIFIPGRGWQVYEVTPPAEAGEGVSAVTGASIAPGRDQLTQRQLRALLGGTLPEFTGRGSGGATISVSLVRAVLGIGVAAAFLTLIVAFAGSRLLPVGSPDEQLRKLARRLARTTSRHRIESPERVGWSRWSAAIERAVTESSRVARPLAALVPLLLSAFFGGRRARRRDVRFAHRVLLRLRRARYRG